MSYDFKSKIASDLNIHEMRKQYHAASAEEFQNLPENPVDLFKNWFERASKLNPEESNAMTLSTVGRDGFPSSRIVLLKEIATDLFIFYTNYSSSKGKDLEKNPNVALNFYWPQMEAQARIKGTASKVSPQKSDQYFASRSRGSQISAAASDQSQPIEGIESLNQKFEVFENKFPEGSEIKRPDFWGGYGVKPIEMEFWLGGPHRRHYRVQYNIEDGGNWRSKFLQP